MTSSFTTMVKHCCDAFRLGKEAEASTLFEQLLAEVTTRIADHPHLMTAALQRSLAIVLRCQQNRDWIGLADEIEYKIIGQLELAESSAVTDTAPSTLCD